jgi:D-3-phosphoglycerate dehydrogenase
LEILLLEQLAPEAQAWLQERHRVEFRPELADDAAALRRQLYNVQAVVLPRSTVVTREFLQGAPLLRAIGRLHVGSENIDLEACRNFGVRVVQGAHAHVRSNAEYLLASLLLLMRSGIGAALRGDPDAAATVGRELHGSEVGLVGLTPSGHALAILLHALGARLLGYDPAVHHTASVWRRLRIQPVGLQELLARADAVSVQVPYASRFQGFFNEKVLAHCKPGQVWASTTHSAVFDPEALAHALTDGRIQAALLDGADPGFAARGSALYKLPNLHLTPRLAPLTRESRLRASWYVAQRLHETLALPAGGDVDLRPTSPAPLDSQSALLAASSPLYSRPEPAGSEAPEAPAPEGVPRR